MTGSSRRFDLEVDALGLLCPLPVLRLSRRTRGQPSGAIVRVLADDPAAAIDIPHWCAEGGHEFLGEEPLATEDDSGGKRPRAYFVRLA